MQPFRKHKGKVAPLYRANIDTDQIIPKQFLKKIEKTGFGEFLFNDWRRSAEGKPDTAFVLNQPQYSGASILVAAKNFGCGSSREHAVWALADYGFRAIIAPSFADIFANNCVKNGVLTVVLNEQLSEEIARRASEIPEYQVTVDLEQRTVTDNQGLTANFQIDEFTRHCLLEGLDDIGLTLQHQAEISAYESRHPVPAAWKS
jgi:3-isopropylmalate/(R)-2-methylmalate dehydratase small subunit